MGLQGLELSILYFFQELHTPFLDKVVPVFTSLGNSGWCFIVMGILLFCFKRTRRMGFLVLLSLAAGFLIGNMAMKNLILRDRPCWIDETVPLLIANPHDFSFPSGHTLAAFEAAFSVFLMNRRWGIPLLVFAALMGLSRLYLFVHFPTDVLSGMALGIFIVWSLNLVLEKYKIYDILISTNKINAE